tara:strand:- start:2169 stop:2774 length:606 start_codon:yes stop_codon:yes gene_type:complete
MPLIKDKYGAKGVRQRPKYVTRKENRAAMEQAPTGLNEQQKREIEKNTYRSDVSNRNEVSQRAVATTPSVTGASPVQSTSGVNSVIVSTGNTAQNLCFLSQGSTLNNILIQNTSSASSRFVSIHWSSGSQDNISFTVTSGIITATAGGSSTCLFAGNIPPLTGLDLSHIVSTLFNKVNKEITLYIAASGASIHATHSITNE